MYFFLGGGRGENKLGTQTLLDVFEGEGLKIFSLLREKTLE